MERPIQTRIAVGSLLLFSLIALSSRSEGAGHQQKTDHSRYFRFEYHHQDAPYMSGILRKAESTRSRIVELIGEPGGAQIRVIMAYTEEEFNQFRPPNDPFPAWVSAVAYPESGTMILRSPRLIPGHGEDTHKTFTHELTHLLLAERYGRHPLPRWLNEGVAMAASGEWHPSQDFVMARAVLTGRLIPLEELAVAFREDERIRQAYIQSRSLVQFLIIRHGEEGLRRLLESLSRGVSFETATEEALGTPFEAFEGQWLRHVRTRYNWIPVLTSSTVLWLLVIMGLAWVWIRKRRQNRRTQEGWQNEELSDLD